jgi:hypothetical protein
VINIQKPRIPKIILRTTLPEERKTYEDPGEDGKSSLTSAQRNVFQNIQSLCNMEMVNCLLPKQHAIKTYSGRGDTAPRILTFSYRWKWSSSRFASSPPGTQWDVIFIYLLHGAEHYLKADCHSACQKISFLMEPEGSSPCSHKPAAGPYPEPAESSSPYRSLSP